MTTQTTTTHSGIVMKTYQAFFTPARYELKSGEREILERGSTYRLPYPGGELAVTTWGSASSTILLLHGWGGARAQMTAFVDPLLIAGYRVVAFDQPAHGESLGTTTNILEISPTLDLIAKMEGPFSAVIAHSFGTLVTSYALVRQNFPPPSRLVYFGSFNYLMDSLPRFQAIARLPDQIIQCMREMLYANFGRDVLDSIGNEALVKNIDIPALLFHDRSDGVTPIEDSRAVARAWKSARLVETDGLGHRGALQSAEIHQQVINFLKT